MTARFRFAFPLGLLALAVLAGCGSSGGTTSTTNAGGGSTASEGQGSAASVEVANNSTLGPILVDAQGRTLYLFQKDTGGKSSCSGTCAEIWPPDIATASPKAGSGVSASKLGTVKRSDGTMQVTYAGHPLYTYTADTSPGQVNGNGVNVYGGIWNAVQPSGANAPAGTSSGGEEGGGTSTSGGGYGY